MESPPVIGVITLDESEMKRVFFMNGEQEKCIQNFVGGILRNTTARRWENNKVIIITINTTINDAQGELHGYLFRLLQYLIQSKVHLRTGHEGK
jgi:hypothetical protein